MFEKNKKSTSVAEQLPELDPNSRNLIAAGTSITGDIVSDGVIRLDGKLKGNLTTAGKLVVGPSGIITGDIKCKNADIEGTIEGKVTVGELLALKSTAKVKGDILTQRLAVEPGAVFNGTCSMSNSPAFESTSDDEPSFVKRQKQN